MTILNMKYIITIKKIETVNKKGEEYQKLTDNPKVGEKQYGYVKHEAEVEQETEIYSQIIDDENDKEIFDLKTIIKAVNQILK